MKGMCTLKIALVIWFQLVVQLLAEYEQAALIFNRHSGSLYDIPSSMSNVEVCDSWANACPAEDVTERKFVTTKTITKNALIVKQICEKRQTLDSAAFKRNNCHYGYKISTLFNKNNWSFEFGYEIYYRLQFGQYFHSFYDRKQYIKLEDLFGSVNEKMSPAKLLYVIKELKRSLFGKDKIVWFNDDYKMHFMWIRLLKISFDFFQWTPKKITYEIRNNNRWPVAWSCRSYNLAEEAYEGVGLDDLYAENNQETIFSNLILPEESSEAACGGKKGKQCLSKWLLIPIDQFHFGTFRGSICSNMATVPLWASTLELVMKKLDKFLYALFRELGTGLYITSGKKGTLHLPEIKSRFFKRDKTAAVHLDSKHSKIPAPDMIYKIVKYKLPNCSDKNKCWLSATVIIHNNPYFDPTSDKKVCKEDVTSAWGWDEVTKFIRPGSLSNEFKSKYIYVCPTNSDVLSRIGQSKSWWKRGQPKLSDFNLLAFPEFDDEEQVYRPIPIEREVFRRILRLNERENDVMPRTPLQGVEEDGENSSAAREVEDILRLTQEIDPLTSDAIIERPQAGADGDIVDEGSSDDDDDDGDIRSNKAQASSPVSSDDDLLFSTPSGEHSYRGKGEKRGHIMSPTSDSEDEFYRGDQQNVPPTMFSPSPERRRSPNRDEKSTISSS